MKAKLTIQMLLLMAIVAFAQPSFATLNDPVKNPAENRSAEVIRLERRLEEIRDMDMRKMSRSEKRALRGEVRAIKKEMATISGGVYISVGALLLIALLLILLL